ncbi:hypothetical protein P0Y35_16680 [Kiritimatiellaeota bacterium B1221]|nr:hypothetical protein [Kiritimatiellaeota bacterium B1221]
MKNFTGKRGWVLVLCGSLILMASGFRHASLIEMRRTENLQVVSPEETTPLVALTTVAFGGFRGLVADALWVRANIMQEEGQYFEMVQLAKWITQLEPRVPEVWSFQAWNLAYNISVLFPEFEDRWRWVNHGLDLLRQKGLTHNPNSPDLHWDIGWMFQHKIGMEFDLAHHLYKQKLREQVMEILPEGKLPEGEVSPETARALKETFAMDVAYMRELDAEYGPLEWRLSQTHVLYWASKGLQFTFKRYDDRRLRRMQMQSLAEQVRGGNLVTSEDGLTIIRFPRMELFDQVIQYYETLLAEGPDNQYLELGYTNFLMDAVLINAEYGNLEASSGYYEKLASVHEELQPGPDNFKQYIFRELDRDPQSMSYDLAMTRLVALLTQAQEQVDPIRASSLRRRAEQTFQAYQQSRSNAEHLSRTGLPPLATIDRLVRKYRES